LDLQWPERAQAEAAEGGMRVVPQRDSARRRDAQAARDVEENLWWGQKRKSEDEPRLCG